MTEEEITLWIQAAAVVAAVGASIIALTLSALDRKNARRIAAEDRRMALKHSKLMFELDVLLRLGQNLRRGGSSDTQKAQDMGAEAAALIGAIGPERLPLNWDKRVDKNDDELRAFIADDTKQDFLRRSVEAQLALNAVSSEINALIEGGGDSGSD